MGNMSELMDPSEQRLFEEFTEELLGRQSG